MKRVEICSGVEVEAVRFSSFPIRILLDAKVDEVLLDEHEARALAETILVALDEGDPSW